MAYSPASPILGSSLYIIRTFISGRGGGREEGGTREKRKKQEECMEERGQMQISEVSPKKY